MRDVVASIESEYRRYKGLGEGVLRQIPDDRLSETPGPTSSSLATLVWHISGNLRSRFTDFLTSDGEKPWRHRETEFEARDVPRVELVDKWEEGWSVLFEALSPLQDSDLGRTVRIRGVEFRVHEALHRSLAHTAYHVGQMTYLGKMIRGDAWEYLSIPPGGSDAYNRNPTMERGS